MVVAVEFLYQNIVVLAASGLYASVVSHEEEYDIVFPIFGLVILNDGVPPEAILGLCLTT